MVPTVPEIVRDEHGVGSALRLKMGVIRFLTQNDPEGALAALASAKVTPCALYAARMPALLDRVEAAGRASKRARSDGPTTLGALRKSWAARLSDFDCGDATAKGYRTLCDSVETLLTTGAAVLPLRKHKKINQLMDEYFASIPERQTTGKPEDGDFAMSNYGILGEASAAHNPGARFARKMHYQTVVPVALLVLFASGMAPQDWFFQQVLDRVMRRTPGKVPAGESAHRDEAIGADPDSIVWGGWIQLAGAPSTFSFVAGSHRNADGSFVSNRVGGFAKESAGTDRSMSQVTVFPGNVIIFWANILHEVSAKRPPRQFRHLPNARVFVGCYLSRTGRPLHSQSAPVLAKNSCRAAPSDPPRLKKIDVRGVPLMSPSSEEAMAHFLTVPTPSGQQFGIATHFK